MKSIIVILGLATFLFACSTGFNASAWTAEGQSVLQPLKKNLMGALMDGMQDGPAAAIQTCKLQAPGMPEAVSGSGYTVGRTSHRLRNADNAPAAWMEPFLAEYNVDSVLAPQAVPLEDGAIGYVEPIYMQGLCLTCHGTRLMPTVSDLLAAEYPNDRAIGFSEGDFRGLFWVRFEPGYESLLTDQASATTQEDA